MSESLPTIVYVTAGQDPSADGLIVSQALEPLLQCADPNVQRRVLLLAFIPVHSLLLRRDLIKEQRSRLEGWGLKTVYLPWLGRTIFTRGVNLSVLRIVGRLVGVWARALPPGSIIVGRSYPASVIARSAASVAGLPWVMDARGVFIHEGRVARRWNEGDADWIAWRREEVRLLKDANRVIAVTPEHRAYLVSRGAEPSRVHTVPCRVSLGVADGASDPRAEQIIADVKRLRETASRVITYSGSLGLWTDPELLLSALARLGCEPAHDALVLLLTPGSLRKWRRVCESVFQGWPLVIASVPTESVQKVLGHCDIGLLPRQPGLVNQVSSPVKLAEYLSAGLAVVAFSDQGFTTRVLSRPHMGAVIARNGGLAEVPASLLSAESRAMRQQFAQRLFGAQEAGRRYARSIVRGLPTDVGKKVRLAALTTGPRLEPCTRQRVMQYERNFRERSMALRVYPFMSTPLHLIKNKRGVRWIPAKVALMALSIARRPFHVARAATADVVLVQKEAFPFGPPFFEQVLARRVPLVFDFDDAHHLVPRVQWDWRSLWRDPERLAKTIRAAKLVTAGNEWLKEIARRAGGREVHLVPTGVAPYNGRAAADARFARRGPVVVGWMGTWSNLSYMDEIVPALRAVSARYPIRVALVGAANVHEWRPEGLDVVSYSWDETYETDHLLGFDIGIMPLVDGEFERGKCAYKILQYMSAALPVVASDVGANSTVVKHGVSGFLARSMPDWEQHIAALAQSSEMRRSFGLAGFETVRRSYATDVCGRTLADLILDALRGRW